MRAARAGPRRSTRWCWESSGVSTLRRCASANSLTLPNQRFSLGIIGMREEQRDLDVLRQ